MSRIASLARRAEALDAFVKKRRIIDRIVDDLRRKDPDWFAALARHSASLAGHLGDEFTVPLLRYLDWRWFRLGREVVPDLMTLTFYSLVERAAKADPERGDDTRRYSLPRYLVEALTIYGLPLDRDCEDCGLLLPEWWPVEDDSAENEGEDFSRCPECGGRVGQDLYRLKQARLRGGG